MVHVIAKQRIQQERPFRVRYFSPSLLHPLSLPLDRTVPNFSNLLIRPEFLTVCTVPPQLRTISPSHHLTFPSYEITAFHQNLRSAPSSSRNRDPYRCPISIVAALPAPKPYIHTVRVKNHTTRVNFNRTRTPTNTVRIKQHTARVNP